MLSQRALVDIIDSSYVTLTNFDVKYAYQNDIYAHTSTKNIDHLTISNGTVSWGGNGIGIYGDKNYGVTNTTLNN